MNSNSANKSKHKNQLDAQVRHPQIMSAHCRMLGRVAQFDVIIPCSQAIAQGKAAGQK
ncbi:MAG TPA: hypothetical protein VMD30_03240 [Tepidisphaeraceae bacterium]|nr:hypothetical protein [Tepidisphaeraceae bacterium]